MPGAACLAVIGAVLQQPQVPYVMERVEVERVMIDARVIGRGDPRPDLKPADFRVKVDGRVVPLESVQWISGATPYAEELSPEAARHFGAPRIPAGRLIVFFFQKDLQPSRTPGLMRMIHEASRMLDTLHAGDLVSVVSFDSHLKLWTDFTDDRVALRRAIEHSVLFQDRPPEIVEGAFPSLASAFDPTAAVHAGTPEKGLLVLAEALRALPGAKTMAYFGWGLGRLTPLGVRMEADYGPAAAALLDSRTTVFTLDVTEADSHSLEVGLQQVAFDTGGFYARTHDFSATAMKRLRRALMGHYVLVFERPPLPRGAHRVEVDLVGVPGEVFAKSQYVD
jgi:VWFA-related protein